MKQYVCVYLHAYNHCMYVLLHACFSLVHSSRRPAAHFCPRVSWWPSGALQSSAGTSSGHAPPPPVEQGGEERRRKTKSKKGSACRQAGNGGGWEIGGGRMKDETPFHSLTVSLYVQYTQYIHMLLMNVWAACAGVTKCKEIQYCWCLSLSQGKHKLCTQSVKASLSFLQNRDTKNQSKPSVLSSVSMLF